MKKICLVVPSLKAGGMERVMSEVANYFSKEPNFEVHLILFSNDDHFFQIDNSVHIYQPKSYSNKFYASFMLGYYLRNTLKSISPEIVLSFGSMYNSFVLLFSVGLKLNIYVSDRSNPYRNTKLTFIKNSIERHDGVLHYFLKKILYNKAAGLLVQTELAKKIEYNYSGHENIILFPNPIREIDEFPDEVKEKWILNVGRFVKTKNQIQLIEIFSEIVRSDWKLVFAGDGPYLEDAKKRVEELNLTEKVIFLGNIPDIDMYMRKSEIFAFPSISEGFPNALAEAMKASLACIAYDCVAGPSDIITDGVNGFLVENGNSNKFREKLLALMENEALRKKFQTNSSEAVEKFNKQRVMNNLRNKLFDI